MFEGLAGRKPRCIDDETYKRYAVAVPFLKQAEELLFQVRSEQLNRQPGEICFPGGRMEPGESPGQAAVRETAEELLVPPQSIEIIAPLDFLLTPAGHLIYPYVAKLSGYDFTFSKEEVQEVFTVPFSFFLNNKPIVQKMKVSFRPETPREFYGLLEADSYPWIEGRFDELFYRYDDKMIWGITARIVNNLVQIYQRGEEGN